MLSKKDRENPVILARGTTANPRVVVPPRNGFTLKARLELSWLYGPISASEALRIGYPLDDIVALMPDGAGLYGGGGS